MKHSFSIILATVIFISGCSENTENKTNNKLATTENSKENKKENLEGESSSDDNEEKELTVEERVAQIKEWYGEIQKIGLQNCKTKKKTRYEKGLLPESDEIPFEQIVKTCELNEDFELIKGEFGGYEWGQEVSVYKKNGKTFFIFVTGGAEAWSYEYRYYFDKDENLIRLLVREADGGNEISGPNKEEKIDPKRKYIKACAKEYFDEIEFVLGKKR
jgi:hypothetical protein